MSAIREILESFEEAFKEWDGKTIEHISLAWSIKTCGEALDYLAALEADSRRLDLLTHPHISIYRISNDSADNNKWYIVRWASGGPGMLWQTELYDTPREAIDDALAREANHDHA